MTKSASDIRQFVLDAAEPVIKHKIAQATGQESELNLAYVDPAAVDDVWKLLGPIIQAANDVQVINAKNTADILKLLGSGKLSISEASQLMMILKTQTEIEEVKELRALVEKHTQNKEVDDAQLPMWTG